MNINVCKNRIVEIHAYNSPRLAVIFFLANRDLDIDYACAKRLCIYPGVNSRAELVTPAPDLRPERRRWVGD